MLLNHGFNLLTVETGEGEHADLLGNVRPVPGYRDSLQLRLESIAHIVHSLGDIDKLGEPFLSHCFVVQNHTCNAGTVLWGR